MISRPDNKSSRDRLRSYRWPGSSILAVPLRRPDGKVGHDALAVSGIDIARLDADMKAHASEIDALIKRNMAQGDAMGFQGTPTYLVGPFMTSTLDYAGFSRSSPTRVPGRRAARVTIRARDA